jgi:hypothetical protein
LYRHNAITINVQTDWVGVADERVRQNDMLVMNLFGDRAIDENRELEEAEYPVEVLESEWNPVLKEIRSKLVRQDDEDSSDA